MEAKRLNRMLQLINKDIPCSESVKTEMNGSCVASLDRFSTKNVGCLTVRASKPYPDRLKKLFLNSDTLK